jgi:hypothetical protein
MRAAIAALPFQTPKLAVHALISEHDMAARLDRAIERSKAVNGRMIEAKAISKVEGSVAKGTDVRLPPPVADRRFRRL